MLQIFNLFLLFLFFNFAIHFLTSPVECRFSAPFKASYGKIKGKPPPTPTTTIPIGPSLNKRNMLDMPMMPLYAKYQPKIPPPLQGPTLNRGNMLDLPMMPMFAKYDPKLRPTRMQRFLKMPPGRALRWLWKKPPGKALRWLWKKPPGKALRWLWKKPPGKALRLAWRNKKPGNALRLAWRNKKRIFQFASKTVGGIAGRYAGQTLATALGFTAFGPVGAIMGGMGMYLLEKGAHKLARGVRKNFQKKQLPFQENFTGFKMYLNQMRKGNTGKMFKPKSISKFLLGGSLAGHGNIIGTMAGHAASAFTGIPYLSVPAGAIGEIVAQMAGEKLGAAPWRLARKIKNRRAARKMERAARNLQSYTLPMAEGNVRMLAKSKNELVHSIMCNNVEC